jgi:hypothetical protein
MESVNKQTKEQNAGGRFGKNLTKIQVLRKENAAFDLAAEILLGSQVVSAQNNDAAKEFKRTRRELIQQAPEEPFGVLEEALHDFSFRQYIDEELLIRWLQAAMICDNNDKYTENPGARAALFGLYFELIELIQALDTINVVVTIRRLNEKRNDLYTKGGNDKLVDNPLGKIADFFQAFSIEYVRKELYDWYEAGIACDQPLLDRHTHMVILMTYEYVLCLVEVAHSLHTGFSRSDFIQEAFSKQRHDKRTDK